MMAIGSALAGAGAVFDIANGFKAQREQKKLFDRFMADLARREEEQKALEAIARGTIRVGLDEGKQLYKNALASVVSSGNAANRMAIEGAAYNNARMVQQLNRRGMLGSSFGASALVMQERENLRAQLDAAGNRGNSIAQLLSRQAQFEMQAADQLASSYRREGQIGAQYGAEYRSALENTQVQFNGIGPALGQLGGLLNGMQNQQDMQQLNAGMMELVKMGMSKMQQGVD